MAKGLLLPLPRLFFLEWAAFSITKKVSIQGDGMSASVSAVIHNFFAISYPLEMNILMTLYTQFYLKSKKLVVIQKHA